MCSGFIADFPNDLDHNIFKGLLGVYIGYSDLAVLKVELLYTVVDGLQMKSATILRLANRKAYALANRDVNFLRFYTRNELGTFIIVQLEMVSYQGSRILGSYGLLRRVFLGSC